MLAEDLVLIAQMHPDSRPHRLLGWCLPPLAALEADRVVLAAARKHRSFEVSRDLQGEPGMDALSHRVRLLIRMATRI